MGEILFKHQPWQTAAHQASTSASKELYSDFTSLMQ